jgi:hypothetical protein
MIAPTLSRGVRIPVKEGMACRLFPVFERHRQSDPEIRTSESECPCKQRKPYLNYSRLNHFFKGLYLLFRDHWYDTLAMFKLQVFLQQGVEWSRSRVGFTHKSPIFLGYVFLFKLSNLLLQG